MLDPVASAVNYRDCWLKLQILLLSKLLAGNWIALATVFSMITGYRAMWIVVMFDLPTDSKQAKRQYTLFRKHLLRDGFTRMQYSVYLRHCPSKENAEVHLTRVTNRLPPEGEVRMLTITDKQFERMQIFMGRMRKPPEAAPSQLVLF